MFAFFKAVQTLRLVLIALRTVASLIILGAGFGKWVKNNKPVNAPA